MVQRRAAVDRGWPVIKDETRPTLSGFDTAPEDVFFFPESEHPLLKFREAHPAGDRSEHDNPPKK
jgi:hypothetical protein